VAPSAFLAHTCQLIGAASEAEEVYRWLSLSSCTVVRVGPLVGWWGPIDHHLGTLAALLGRSGEAEERLERALSIERRMGAQPFAARTLAQLAAVRRLTRPDAADKTAEEAEDLAQTMGAAGIIAEVQAAVT
jgi:hypothetical protein